MNASIPARIHARSRADRRLQSMTLGAAALGIAATGVFGYAAALTYTGATSTVSAAERPASAGAGGQGQSAPAAAQGQAASGGVSDQSGQGGGILVNPFFGSQQAVTAPATTGGHSHAVSGGS